ncbi:Ig-like domain-containing protein [Pontibacter sp. G13]|uniref:Ig-like domain-containing protein n=1 Tax=Pontibacter sp. G13 TaxID=3074898 RepID=UPI00288A92E8|nr:Ig-like domain-containing protein [Pontibacter sp. G13]WNJ20283.1 Ig-like domain-containing protein [Pontibacter sp. G13]
MNTLTKLAYLCLALLLGPGIALADSTVFHSDFEVTLDQHWTSNNVGGMPHFERTQAESYTGSWSFHMKFSAANQKGNLTTDLPIEWKQSTSYRISFWYKATTPNTTTTSNLKFFQGNGTKLDQINFDWTSSTWTKWSGEFIPGVDDPLGNVLFSFRPNGSGGGEIYIDDVKIEEIIEVVTFETLLKTQSIASDTSIVWRQFGPGMSGNNKSAFWHPTDPDVLFIAPNMGNAYRSTDRGLTYETIMDPDAPGNRTGIRGPRDITSLDFSRQDPTFGFCTDEKNLGLFVTTDMGKTWRLKTENNGTFGNSYLSCVAVDPADDQIWYVGAGRMRDLGHILFSKAQPHGTFVDAQSQGKIWKSTNGGATWSLSASGLDPQAEVETILVDPNNSSILYCSTNYGFYKSINAGATWIKKSTGLGNDVIRSMSMHHDDSSGAVTLFVINSVMWRANGNTVADSLGGVFKSVDGGETWQNINGNLAIDLTQFAGNSSIEKAYYHVVAYYFGITDDQAKNQFPVLPSSLTQRITQVSVDPNDVNHLFLVNMYSNSSRNGFKPVQLWRSTDGGQNWFAAVRNGTAWNTGSDIAYWQQRGNPIGSNISLRYLSHWMDRDDYERKACNFARFNADGTVLHTQMAKISLMSYDGGDNWVDIDDEIVIPGEEAYVGAGSSNVPGHGFYQHPDMPGKMFCMAGENTLWVTIPGGDAIRPNAQAAHYYSITPEEQSLSSYVIAPNDTNIRYALFFRQHKRGEILKTTDGGHNWTPIGTPIPAWDLQQHSGDQSVHQLGLKIDPERPDHLFFYVPVSSGNMNYVGNSATAFGLHKSIDGGLTWTEPNTGLPASLDVAQLVFDPQDSDIMYAAIQKSNGGLFKSVDQGETWNEVSSVSPLIGSLGVNDIHFSEDGKVYITTGYRFAGKNEGGLWVSEDGMLTWTKILDHPWVYRVLTPPYDPSTIITVTLANGNIEEMNPGTFLSKDGGATWVKCNTGNGQSDRINDIIIDQYQPGVYYTSTFGSGWYVAHDPNPNPVSGITSLAVSPSILQMSSGDQMQLTATITPTNADIDKVIWSSEDPYIATVDNQGMVTVHQDGSTTIWAKAAYGDAEASVPLTVSTNLETPRLADLVIYPNPANTEITISWNQGAFVPESWELLDLGGRRVLSGAISQNDLRKLMIETSDLPDGAYILKLTQQTETISSMIRVQHTR